MKDLEHQEQKAFIQWTELRGYPFNLIFAIPNGGKRNIVTAVKLKAEGVKAGIPDLFFPYAMGEFHGMFIEMKAGKNKATPKQIEMMTQLYGQGFFCVVCQGAAEAMQELNNYIVCGD